ncbi:MAG: oxidoreductase-like domain-containing protein [Burkholderiaceae bacterium]
MSDPLDDDPPPEPPLRPDPEDCCRSGCVPCVFDIYADELARYETALRAWRARHPERGATPAG